MGVSVRPVTGGVATRPVLGMIVAILPTPEFPSEKADGHAWKGALALSSQKLIPRAAMNGTGLIAEPLILTSK